ncbi:hypothetical protein GCM10025783_30370 [Amnibacterium soli]|uniref:DUF4175 domain-containing protein n=1 Tax=Amnibacterium soli TaxID=1282736 RepID=A0ABP8ZF84_9MICO
MTQEPISRKWTDSPGAQFALATLFLALTIAWLLFSTQRSWSYWVPALAWLLLASTWLVRGIRQIAATRSPRHL